MTTSKKREANEINKQGIICVFPFTSISFFFNGTAWSCNCPHWPKYKIGNIKNSSIAELWNNDTARWIRRKMYQGEWQKICKPTCPIITDYLRSRRLTEYEDLEKNELMRPGLIKEIRARKDFLKSPPTYLQPDISGACNLRCIMCNTHQLKYNPVIQKKLWIDLKYHLSNAKEIFLTGLGDPFARPDTRELLIKYRGPAKFHILTNGLLLPKYWKQIKSQIFASLSISLDAATKETYEKIRIGGKWEDLLRVLDLVKQNKNKFGFIVLNMTVMRSNYKEIPQFIDLAESCGFNCFFQSLWGKFDNENIFELKDIIALENLKKIIINETSKNRSTLVLWGNLLSYLDIPLNINLRCS